MIYLDYAASTPMTEQAITAYAEIATKLYGNATSPHDAGSQAGHAVEAARKVIAQKLGVHSDGIIFTGSGTEANILAILSIARSEKRGRHIITSMAEHTSVHAAMNTLEREGFEVTRLPLKKDGLIDIEAVKAAIRPDTTLISIQHVNSEIGTIQPIARITQLAKEQGIYTHVDCVQSFCKLDVANFAQLADAISVSAHKVGGPKGCGAVYLNPFIRVEPVFPGVTHEKGLRGGTLDTPSIVAFAVAVENYTYHLQQQWQLREKLVSMLDVKKFQVIESVHAYQLPNIVGICKKGMEGQLVMLRLNEQDIYISTGSACDSNSASGTKAILAMGKSMTEARQFFRISFGANTTMNDVATCGRTLQIL